MATVVSTLHMYSVTNHLPGCISSDINFVWFFLWQGGFVHCCQTVLLFQTTIFFDEINMLFSVLHICLHGFWLIARWMVIDAIWHPMNQNHESWNGQLWGVTFYLFASVHTQICHWSFLPCPAFFLTPQTLFAHFFKNILIHCQWIHLYYWNIPLAASSGKS